MLRRARLRDRGVDVVERCEEVLERGFSVDGVKASYAGAGQFACSPE